MPSDGADFRKHRQCYGRIFTLVKEGADCATISPLILDGMAHEIRRFAPQIALKPGIAAVAEVLQSMLKCAGGLFDEVAAARASLKTVIDKVRRDFANEESTRLICDGLAKAGHAFISQVQNSSQPSISTFEDEALKAVFREQAAHNIVDPLRDYHLRFQGLAPEQYDERHDAILDRTESEGVLLMKACLRSKAAVPSKHWRTGGKSPSINDIDSLNTALN